MPTTIQARWRRLVTLLLITSGFLVASAGPLSADGPTPLFVAQASEKKPTPKVRTKPTPKGNKLKGGSNDGPANGLEFAAKHLQVMLDGVMEILTQGVPGPLCVYGPRAFPVVIDSKDTRNVVMVAAAELGQGRVVALPHNGYFGDLVVRHPMTGRLLSNVIHWAAGQKTTTGARPRIAVRGYAPLRQLLNASGAAVTELPDRNWVSQIGSEDVVVADLQQCNADEVQALDSFIRQGGGVVAANLIWGWKQSHADADPKIDHPGNQLFSRAGIVWADGTTPSASGATVKVDLQPAELSHVAWCLDVLDNVAAKKRTLTAAELERIPYTLAGCYDAIPREQDAGIFARLENYVEKQSRQIPTPSEQTPIAPSQANNRLLVAVQTEIFNHLPVSDLKPSPTAATFPGTLTSKVKRKSRKVSIDFSQAGWKSTGVYALPGDRIKVSTDPETAKRGFSLQIGCHRDSLLKVDAPWKRPPEMIRRFPLNQPSVEIGHALGGLVYVDVPEKASSGQGDFEFTNIVDAPYYVHGVTSRSAWNSIQNFPAPWAELETRNFIITVPSELIRGLGFPDRLMEHWTQVVDACADLATIPRERKTPQRIVFDVQISAGFMHSGYPIMAWIKPSAPEVVNLELLQTKGGWGFYHELGHNHQQSAWTFDGTVEVTCNLFSMYVLETLTPRAFKHQQIQLSEKREKERAYIAKGGGLQSVEGRPVPGADHVPAVAGSVWLGRVQESLCGIPQPAAGSASEDRRRETGSMDGSILAGRRQEPWPVLQILGHSRLGGGSTINRLPADLDASQIRTWRAKPPPGFRKLRSSLGRCQW